MSNDKTKYLGKRSFWRKSLAWRILLSLFLAFLSLELLFLYPIVRIYEVNQLRRLEQEALLSIRTLFQAFPQTEALTKQNQDQNPNLNQKQNPTPNIPTNQNDLIAEQELTKISHALTSYPLFKGIVIAHGDGKPLLRAGEKPGRPMNDLPLASYLSASLRDEDGTRYDVFWDNAEDNLPYDITLRLDTSNLSREIENFVFLTLMLMLLFAALNALLGFIVFKKFLLNHYLKFKKHFLSIANDPLHPEQFVSNHFARSDLAEIETLYNELLKRLADAQKTLKAHDAVLELRVTERTKELAQLANYDLITDLPNRNLLRENLNETIEEAKSNNKQVVLMLLILRDYHEINNAYGHAVGTKFLKEVARNLTQDTPGGTFIAHLSTSHFAIARGGLTSTHHIVNLAQWILDLFNKPLMVEERNLLSAVNLGIAIYPMDGDDADQLMANANLALNRAIDSAANSYQFYEANMNKITEARRSILVDLHYAIERNQLLAYYQPQVDLKTNKIIGVEALLRWMHPEKGLMPPGLFISLAEESGLIIPMGEWMLKTACQQAKNWEKAGLPKLTMAVNLSGAQFKQKNIMEIINRTLIETELPAEQLEVEITESIIVTNIQEAIATMKGLRGIGLSISIDDFGTGYSSLSYLRSFPIQKIKIDQSFVRDIFPVSKTKGENQPEKPLADIILLLAKNLNVLAIAEGIETEEQAEYLRSRGCDEGQGYLFGKPMTAAEIEALFKK